jgi:hypothetical protein
VSYVDLILTFGWILAVSRAGRAASRLPRPVAGAGLGLGAAGLAGAVLLAALVPARVRLVSPEVTYAAEWLVGIPVALYPAWLIVLSDRLPGHVADRLGLVPPAADPPAARPAN